MKILLPSCAAVLALSALPAAQAQSGTQPRISQIIVYGDDPCPPSTDDEVIVCARRPETDRYRIPEQFRHGPEQAEQSWAVEAQSLEYVGRTGIQSCSTVGPGGWTGCWAEMIRQARREREAQVDAPQP